MTHEQYREIFRIIDGALWEDAIARNSEGWIKPKEARIRLLENSRRDAKKILSAYIDQSTERMKAVITSKSFSRLPLPKREVPAETKSGLLLSLLPIIAELAVHAIEQEPDVPPGSSPSP